MLAHTRYKHSVVGGEQIGVPGGGFMDQLGKWKTQNHLAPEVYVFRFCIYSRLLIHKDHKAPLHQFLEWMDGIRYGLCHTYNPFIHSSIYIFVPHSAQYAIEFPITDGNPVSIINTLAIAFQFLNTIWKITQNNNA